MGFFHNFWEFFTNLGIFITVIPKFPNDNFQIFKYINTLFLLNSLNNIKDIVKNSIYNNEL